MDQKIRTIFDEAVLGALATRNEDGSPWVSPLHVVTDGDYVYWFSKSLTQHSQNIDRDPRVSLTLFSPDESGGPKGVYVNGSAEKLVGDEDVVARQVATERLGTLPPVFDVAAAYRLPLGQFDGQKSTGNCWYFYS